MFYIGSIKLALLFSLFNFIWKYYLWNTLFDTTKIIQSDQRILKYSKTLGITPLLIASVLHPSYALNTQYHLSMTNARAPNTSNTLTYIIYMMVKYSFIFNKWCMFLCKRRSPRCCVTHIPTIYLHLGTQNPDVLRNVKYTFNIISQIVNNLIFDIVRTYSKFLLAGYHIVRLCLFINRYTYLKSSAHQE